MRQEDENPVVRIMRPLRITMSQASTNVVQYDDLHHHVAVGGCRFDGSSRHFCHVIFELFTTTIIIPTHCAVPISVIYVWVLCLIKPDIE